MLKHIDGGLTNTENASHVLAAVQTLLHCSPMVNFLLGDTEHRKSCRSLLCMCCAFFKVYDAMAKTGTGNPTALVLKWNDVSRLMSLQDKFSPLKVLEIFIDKLRFEQFSRKDDFEVLHSCTVSQIWKSSIQYRVECSCGQYDVCKQVAPLCLQSVVCSLSTAIENELEQSKKDTCNQCGAHSATFTPLSPLRLAEALIVHLMEHTADFTVPLSIKVYEENFDLRSIISETNGPKGNVVFMAVCPDGLCRRFDDTKIVPMSITNFFMDELIKKPRLTLIYEKKKEANKWLLEEHHQKKDLNSSLPAQVSLQVSGLDISEEEESTDNPSQLEARASDAEKSTHTRVASPKSASTVDKGVQTLPYFTYETCRHDKKFKLYTGLSVEDFEVLYNFIGGFPVISKLKFKYSIEERVILRPSKISCRDKLFMFLLRLRRGLPLEELSKIFNCSVSWAGEICYAMTRLIYLSLKEIEKEMFPTAEEQRRTKPDKMKPFENLRILLDGVSFRVQVPSNFEQQGNTYSKYKSGNVIVFSVGISCNGATTFCSDGMEGNMSDKQVILHSDLLSRLSPGDGVMTDRGYELSAELEAAGCIFYKPPSRIGDNVLTAEEEILTRAIATARIYTEHAMADIKDNRLLQGEIPLSMLPVLSDLVYIAAYLRNFNKTRILNKTIRPREHESDNANDPAKTTDTVKCVDLDDPDDPERLMT